MLRLGIRHTYTFTDWPNTDRQHPGVLEERGGGQPGVEGGVC